MRVLVCGSRDANSAAVWNWLEKFGHQDACDALGWGTQITTVIHGGARGADEGAGSWGESQSIRVLRFAADWRKHGKAAGPMRNARMLREGRPDLVIAFPGGRGTADMVRQAEVAGVPVLYPARLGFTPDHPPQEDRGAAEGRDHG